MSKGKPDSSVQTDNDKLLAELTAKATSMAAKQVVESPPKQVADPEIERLRAELRARDEQIRLKDEQIQDGKAKIAAMTDNSGKPVKPSEVTTEGEGYLFEVTITNPKLVAVMPPDQVTKQIRCCDESEAKRWYCVTTNDPRNPGTQVSTTNDIRVVCLDNERREANIRQSRLIAHVREKANTGRDLTPDEELIYKSHVLGL